MSQGWIRLLVPTQRVVWIDNSYLVFINSKKLNILSLGSNFPCCRSWLLSTSPLPYLNRFLRRLTPIFILFLPTFFIPSFRPELDSLFCVEWLLSLLHFEFRIFHQFGMLQLSFSRHICLCCITFPNLLAMKNTGNLNSRVGHIRLILLLRKSLISGEINIHYQLWFSSSFTDWPEEEAYNFPFLNYLEQLVHFLNWFRHAQHFKPLPNLKLLSLFFFNTFCSFLFTNSSFNLLFIDS